MMRHHRRRTRHRALTVLAAPIAAVIAWSVLRACGVPLVTDSGTTVGVLAVAAVAALAALAGWGVVAVLQRRTRHPALWWGLLASATLSLSMLGPGQLASGWSLTGLIVLHFVTAAVVMGGMAATLAPTRRAEVTAGRTSPAPSA